MTSSFHRVVWAAAMAFISTTIDDFVVIVYFMSRAENRLLRSNAQGNERFDAYSAIVIGVVLGFSVIVLLSLLGVIFSFVNIGYVCLLGFIPILIGLKQGLQFLRDKDNDKYLAFCDSYLPCVEYTEPIWTCGGLCNWFNTESPDEDDDEDDDDRKNNGGEIELGTGLAKEGTSYTSVSADDEVQTAEDVRNPVAALSAPDDQSHRMLDRNEDRNTGMSTSSGHSDSSGEVNVDQYDEEDEVLKEAKEEESPLKDIAGKLCGCCLDKNILEVMLVMIGVGSDNVAIYMVIFAVDSVHEVILTIFVFYILLFVNIAFAALLMKCKNVAVCMQKYAEGLVPVVLILLGVFILQDSVLFGGSTLE